MSNIAIECFKNKYHSSDANDYSYALDKFDRIYLVHYVGYKERCSSIRRELERMKIWGRENFRIKESVRTEPEKKIPNGGSTDGERNLALCHAEIISEAYAKGFKRILVFEDDVEFLSDVGLCLFILNNVPSEGYINLDPLITEDMDRIKEMISISEEGFAPCSYPGVWGTSAYVINKDAVEYLYKKMYSQERLPVADYWEFSDHFKRFFSIINICHQIESSDSIGKERGVSLNYGKSLYLKQGLNIELYGDKKANHVSTIKYFTTRALGRLCNQLYYVLQAFCMSVRTGERWKFVLSNCSKDVGFGNRLVSLNLLEYATSENKSIDAVLPDGYYQRFNKDFSKEELQNFIKDTILPVSNGYRQESDIDNTVLVIVRNTDYLDDSYTYYDRVSYYKDAFDKLPLNIVNCVVSSDDNHKAIELIGNILLNRFQRVSFLPTGDAVHDLMRNSFYKYQILSASTYSYWSAFISNVRYGNNHANIIAPWAMQRQSFRITAHACEEDDRWTIIPVDLLPSAVTYFKQQINKIIIPVSDSHTETVSVVCKSLRKFMSGMKISVVSSETVRDRLSGCEYDEWIDESNLSVERQEICRWFKDANYNEKRAGWYYQQFLKFAYANKCKDGERYVVWDADTIPLRKIEFIDEHGRLMLSETSENHKPYFDTIRNILGEDYAHRDSGSYISNYMVFDAQAVREIMSLINNNVKGNDPWYIKVLRSIAPSEVNGSGFSEYETYGCYLEQKCGFAIRRNPLRLLRLGRSLLDQCGVPMSKAIMSLTNFDAICFESWDTGCMPLKSALYRDAKSMLLVEGESDLVTGFQEKVKIKIPKVDEFVDGDFFEGLGTVPGIVYRDIDFYEDTFKARNQKGIMLVHNGDRALDSEAVERFIHQTQYSDLYAVNLDFQGDRLHPLPLGLERVRWASFPKREVLEVYQHQPIKIKNLVYANFSLNTNTFKRSKCANVFRDKCYCEFDVREQLTPVFKLKDYEYAEFCKKVKESLFVLCPEGNGIDTHRTWETLALGRIPVVIRNTFYESFSGLPMLLLDKWEDFEDRYLDFLRDMSIGKFDYAKCTRSYWNKKLRG